MKFPDVTAVAKANVYFDGRVVSHTILSAGGARKTLGLIYPGTYHFGTEAAELMQIVDGKCRVVLDGTEEISLHEAGGEFRVPANSGFSITVEEGICQYVCSFLN